MTDLLTTDHADTGEIPPYDTLGVEATRDLRAHRRDTTGEATRNLAHDIAGLPPRRRPSADNTAKVRLIEPALGLNHHDMDRPRVIEMDETVTFLPHVVGLDDKPHPKPPSLPPNPKCDPETAVLSLLGSVAGVDGELRMAPLPRPIPDGMPPRPTPPKPNGYEGRHRDPQDRHAIPGEGQWGRLVDAAKPQGEPRRWRVFTGVSAFVAFAAAVTFVVLVVFW